MRKSATAKIDTAHDEPELIVDREFKSPKPLDRRIATVLLRTPTNNPTEGYDLLLSATFGKERVLLKAGEFEIDVNFSVKTADIELKFVRCTYALVNNDQGGRIDDGKTTIKHRSGVQTKAVGNIGAEGAVEGIGVARSKARAGASYEKGLTSTSTTERSVTQYDWHRLGGDTIQVGPTGKMLDGATITDCAGWRVTPSDKNDTSGVIARVKVREHWINFDGVLVRKTPAGLMQKVRDLLSPERRQRKEYFQLLLRHLAQTELRDHQDGKDATIAAHVILVRPFEEHAVSVYAGESRREIAIDGDQLVQFLTSEEGHEAGALIALGLQRDIITTVADEDADRPKKRGTVFVPDSAPPHAAALFKQIHDRRSLTKSELVHPTSLKDLRALDLVKRDRSGIIKLKVEPGISSEASMRRAVSEMACIKVARAVLRIKPDASPIDIADAVALELGKNWPTRGTRIRNGNAIIRWTVWLEPHLLDPASSSEAAARVAYATDPNVTKGRPSSLRNSAEPELRRLLAQGESIVDIAKRFKVHPTTINNWKNRLGL